MEAMLALVKELEATVADLRAQLRLKDKELEERDATIRSQQATLEALRSREAEKPLTL